MINLSSITSGCQLAPPRIFIYAVEGIGKSTFAAGAPDPIFIPTEDGLGALPVARFPLARSVSDVIDAISALCAPGHEYKSVVVDSVDWLEQIISREIEEKYKEKELAYGKASIKLADAWSKVLAGLDALRQRGMAVILIGHSHIKRFDAPDMDPYDRYQPKLAERSSAMIREWADAVLFANYSTSIKRSSLGFGKEVSRGVGTGERVIYTSERPGWMAKNRYSLPDSIPLSWNSLSAAIAASMESK